MPSYVISCNICIHDMAFNLKCKKGYLRSYSDNSHVITPFKCASGEGDFQDMRKHCKFSNSEGI